MRRLLTAALVAAIIGIPALILQRYVAETRNAAIFAVLAWFAICAIGLVLATRRRRDLRLPAWGTYAAVLIGVVAVGYWTGFRDRVVDENIVVASAMTSEAERQEGLAAGGGGDAPATQGPVELARGTFEGADGHAGSGVATVVRQPGRRLLTFSRFDVVSDRVDLGSLKGNVGDQQYEIPPEPT